MCCHFCYLQFDVYSNITFSTIISYFDFIIYNIILTTSLQYLSPANLNPCRCEERKKPDEVVLSCSLKKHLGWINKVGSY